MMERRPEVPPRRMRNAPSQNDLSFLLDPRPVGPRRLVCVGHALKETLSVQMARKALELGVQQAESIVAAGICVSDGGDGFLDSFRALESGTIVEVVAHDPLGRLALCPLYIGRTSGMAAIEMAKCCGLAMIPPTQRNIMDSGTASLAELIHRAISLGAARIHIGLGGSATCDGGLGMMMRLEELLLGRTLEIPHYTARHLAHGLRPDIIALRNSIAQAGCELIVYTDVANPLLGPKGAARLFAPQKGATAEQVEQLEQWMENHARLIESEAGVSLRDLAGAGAAGGMGFALAALGCEIRQGADQFFRLTNLPERLRGADGLLTCEGRFDRSSLVGKAPWKAALLARGMGLDAWIACGAADEEGLAAAREKGITVVEFGRDVPPDRRAAEAFTRLSQSITIALGGRIGR